MWPFNKSEEKPLFCVKCGNQLIAEDKNMLYCPVNKCVHFGVWTNAYLDEPEELDLKKKG